MGTERTCSLAQKCGGSSWLHGTQLLTWVHDGPALSIMSEAVRVYVCGNRKVGRHKWVLCSHLKLISLSKGKKWRSNTFYLCCHFWASLKCVCVQVNSFSASQVCKWRKNKISRCSFCYRFKKKYKKFIFLIRHLLFILLEDVLELGERWHWCCTSFFDSYLIYKIFFFKN